jgi:hypothetical protein
MLLVEREAKRFNFLAAGRRWRKTTFTSFRRVLPQVLIGKKWLWCAPTYDQVRIAWDELVKGCHAVARFNGSRMAAEFPGGGQIFFRSLDDPDNARGFTADGVAVDEAQDCEERAWYEVLRPMLMDTHGEAWLQGTPKGRNYFWREYSRITDPDNHEARIDSAAWQIPTLGVEITPNGLVRKPHPYENPHIPFAEVKNLFATMTEMRFRQEILAEFIDDAGGVFRGVMACATAPHPRDVKPYRGTFVIGVDWGKSKDFTVLTCIDVTKRQVVDLDRFNQIDWHVQRARLHAMYRKWKDATGSVSVVAEQNSIGSVLISELARGDKAQGLGPIPVRAFETNNTSKGEIIERLAMFIENKRLSYPNIPSLVNELQAFESTRLPSGLLRYGAPEGEHDDHVMSLAIACEGLGEAWPIDTAMPAFNVSQPDLEPDLLAAL